MSTIEDVQNGIDDLLLSLFSAVHMEDTREKSEEKVLASFGHVMGVIDNLDGIDMKEEESLEKMRVIDAEYEATRSRVLALQKEVKEMESSVDCKVRVLVMSLDQECGEEL